MITFDFMAFTEYFGSQPNLAANNNQALNATGECGDSAVRLSVSVDCLISACVDRCVCVSRLR